MELLIILFIALPFIIGIVALLKLKTAPAFKRGAATDDLPYLKKEVFFTDNERAFYRVLKSAVGQQYEIFARVNLEDLLELQKDLMRSDRQFHLHKMKGQQIDYILCDPNNSKVLCVIELEHKTSNRQVRVKHDDFISDVFKAVGLTLVRFEAKQLYDENEIVSRLQGFIDGEASKAGKEPEA